ncbi:Mg2+/Co2+ transporter CorB [Polynucleobacter sphagniphilus]|jgi:Mg2+/Co2+ transporter CorB|uniref:Mg2+/Co2+ transporter CorB n=1 Tax=Polynucleobacter sphagniphilus TaxID=1743169 RepID=A0AA43MAS8_9BURK|nr:CNNM domain-containing protein [Polynucleobacter sphagniphilus]MDF9787697.1 Mg2+/Co2+ transporter CorB [Polynucleobacter sphagniphilus]MDH6242099.1 Mg2+/Co2+ transporter CorB [Polynucleobacter sphagniphilus]MDH6298983.1 Mg2+/Co2+ transporter CorB [Polynucleobacter sphagniphilus]MDH6302003.1 Mg2+/Co2+ transporter CorB [Polynucleobacter sphagniphilus]MDH6421047.1 Mg2+/Co2+ transporter CorB [Polynucleobacter sphagniphilus]
MDTFFHDWPFAAQVALVIFLLALSGFFSMAETSMLSSNRHRLRAMANSGNAGAALAARLLKRIDSLLSVLLISNNLINTVLPILVTGIALHIFGDSGLVLSVATLVVALLIIIFSEITPKVIGAAFPEKIASNVGWLILPLTYFLKPLLWFINNFVSGLMKVSGLQANTENRTMSKEELRSLVLESNRFVSTHHRNILLNLFNLETISVDDVMTPRSKIEILDLSRPINEVVEQLETCYHNKLPVCDGDSERIIGILSVKKTLSLLGNAELKHEDFRSLVSEPYFIPSGTPVLQQMQFFQDNQQRLSLVVNEYGEVLGLVTFEDIVEELIGEFTTSFSNLSNDPRWLADGTYLANGGASLRDLNRLLNLDLPLDGPRTLNGLILEKLEAIPDHDVSMRIAGIVMEIIQFDEHGVKTVKLYQPTPNTKKFD